MGYAWLASWQGLLALFMFAVFIYGWHPIKRIQYRHIPGPPPLWLIGNLLGLVKKERPQALEEWAKTYGPIFKFFQGGSVVVVVSDPEAARSVNMQNHSRPPLLTFFAGEEAVHDDAGIFFTDSGPYWQSLRQAWQCMFHPDSLRGYIGFINHSADQFVESLAPMAKSGEDVEIWRLLGRLTMDVVGSSAFGLELGVFESGKEVIAADSREIDVDNEKDDVGIVLQKVAAVSLGVSDLQDSMFPVFTTLFPELKPIIGRLAVWFPDRVFKRLLVARKKMRDICFDLVDESRAKLAATSVAGADANTDSTNEHVSPTKNNKRGLPPGGFVQHLLQADNKLLDRPFTNTEIAAQVNTFLLAGYETTGNALAFTCYFLAGHPEAEAKLLEEVDSFGRSMEPSYDDLSNFPYLTACFEESMRLLSPSAFGTMRINRKDTVLCGKTVPKGAYVNMGMNYMHLNEAYWADAGKFKPERMMSSPGSSSHAWAPFGQGGRACAGKRLAYIESQITLIKLYQLYTLRLVDGQVPLPTKTMISMQPANGVHVTIHSRS